SDRKSRSREQLFEHDSDDFVVVHHQNSFARFHAASARRERCFDGRAARQLRSTMVSIATCSNKLVLSGRSGRSVGAILTVSAPSKRGSVEAVLCRSGALSK